MKGGNPLGKHTNEVEQKNKSYWQTKSPKALRGKVKQNVNMNTGIEKDHEQFLSASFHYF